MKPSEAMTILRRHLDPALTALGFTKLEAPADHLIAWSRQLVNRKYETICCEFDPAPWDPWIGSRFYLTFQQWRRPHIGPVRGAKRAPLGALLVKPERKSVQALQNRVIKKARMPSKAEYNALRRHNGFNEHVADDYRELCRPISLADRMPSELWLRYLDAEDLAAWGKFLALWLPHGLDHFMQLEGLDYLC